LVENADGQVSPRVKAELAALGELRKQEELSLDQQAVKLNDEVGRRAGVENSTNSGGRQFVNPWSVERDHAIRQGPS